MPYAGAACNLAHVKGNCARLKAAATESKATASATAKATASVTAKATEPAGRRCYEKSGFRG